MKQKFVPPSTNRATVLQGSVIAIFCLLLFAEAQWLGTATQSIARADQIIGADQELIRLTIDMETSLRAFLYTGSPVFLQPYHESEDIIDSRFDALQQLISGDPSQGARLAAARELTDRWRKQAATSIAQRNRTSALHVDDPDRLQMLGRKALMDQIRAQYATLIASEMVVRAQSVNATHQRSWLLSISCFLMVVGGGGFLGYLLRHQMERLSGALQKSWDVERTAVALALQVAQREKEDAVSNYRGQVEAISRSQMMIDLSLDGTIIAANENYLRVFGFTAAELQGRHHSFFVTDDQRDSPAYKLFWENLKAGIFQSGEFLRIGKDGREVWIEASYNPILDREGNATRIVKFATDVSARKLAEKERERQEKALRKSEELLDRTGRMAGVGGWELDLDSRTVHWTDETARLHGLEAGYQPSLDEGIGFYVPEVRPAVYAAIEKATLDGLPWELEAQVRCPDGRLMWAMVKGSVEFLNGKAVRMVGAFQDITALVLAQKELRYQASLLDLSHDTIMMRDLEGKIEFWNHGAEQMYGYSKTEAIGAVSHTLLRTIFPLPLAEIEAEFLQEGRWEGELQHILRDGTPMVVSSRWVLQRDANGLPMKVLESNNDITDWKMTEEMLRKAISEAEEATRSKSEFLANMSHEIRTPMNAVMGMTHLALRANPTPKQAGYLKKIGSAADSLLTIINDILDFSKVEAGKVELEKRPFPVEKLLMDLNDLVGEKARRKNIALSFSIAREVPAYLVGDSLRLGQIMINLVDNGLKFTREGSVAVTVTAAHVTDHTAHVSFAVTDTGIGMTQEQLAGLFQPFNQADPSVTRRFGGTGLGLAISKQLSQLMGGTITASSQQGFGTTFTLQAQFGIAKGIQSVAVGEDKPETGRKLILVVDDSADARDVLVAMLAANGFQSRTVSSGEEVMAALSDASRSGQPFDLVLMDWRMPGVNGLEIARQIKAQLEFFSIPSIVMVSAFDRELVMRGVSDPGLEGFLIKPVKESILIETIHALLRENPSDTALINRSETVAPEPSDLAGRRVLLVEDNDINRDLATELLSDLGIVVLVAADGRESVNRITAEPFDLVLMDIQMPVMDGLTATRLVRSDQRFNALPIIAMTAHAMSGDREKSLQAGMNDHITKPINPDGLTATLLRWMPGKVKIAIPPTEVAPVAPGDPDLPEQLPPFNLQAALVRTNGKPKLLRKMMQSFCKQYAEAGPELRLLVDHGRIEEAERLAHSLKGSARTLEAADLGNAAETIEIALRAGATDGMHALIHAMEETLTLAIAAGKTLDSISPTPDPVEVSTRPPLSTILVVDDDPAYLELLTDIFSEEHKVLSATRGIDAIATATAMLPDVILLDVMMPGLDGYEVCSLLKKERLACSIPLIFLTGLGDVANETKALAMGAVDYVTKPINPLAVKARVNHQVQLKRAQNRLVQLATEDLLAQLRKETEHAEELERMSRHELELRDHFLSHVSHELRSPLTAIYMFSSIIADGLAGATTAQQDEYLGLIDKNIGQLKAMIEDLLLVSAAKQGELQIVPQTASLSTAIADAITSLRGSSALKGVSFSSSVNDDLLAYADPVRLLQVITILCDNAIKFTPSGGSVHVEAHPFAPDPAFLLVEVSDTGCGISHEMTERVFQHLHQISAVNDAGRHGLGLGLHIAKELVTRQRGKIWAEALPTAGSKFSFTIPAFHETQTMVA